MPPYITDVSHPALVKWKRERQEYEDAIEARCATTGEDKSKALQSVKNYFNRNLLKTLCKLEWGTTIEEVTEERILSELDIIIGNVMNDDIVDIDALFDAELKMDLSEPDVKARVINYFMLCDDIILQRGLGSMFSTTTGMKEKCKLLKQHLEPVALRDAVDTHHRLVDSSSKTDEQALYQLVKDKALEQEKVFRLLAKQKKHQFDWPGKPRREPSKGLRAGVDRSNSTKVVRDGDDRRMVVVAANPAQKSAPIVKSKPRTGCFHCGKDHWLSQCPYLDEAAKEALLAERKAKKGSDANSGKRFRAKRLESPIGVDNDGRATVVLNGKLGLPYCADSGSDPNVISRAHVELLQAQDPTVHLIELNEAVESRAVGGTLLTSPHAVDLRLTLNTAAGPVRCQDTKRCLIVESDEDEVLIGKELLAELGIDIERQLEYLASREEDGDDVFDEPAGIPDGKPAVGEVVLNVVNALYTSMEDGDLSWAMIHPHGSRHSRSS
ncbi:hypothetical protein PF010_g21617 [Phytophthora fragariae]|uniref:Uncharacterized protein n=1 Tax=Phytophthora fragariae TaxID=53985 RepID=A0A6A3JV34_9STRA|nr:hypothetical protein PF011_g15399 [Phytophthora fragariae]KAE9082360.1 hypothetical protein PF010_g21617 [Phytophthora fragariae]